nr:immunoglobulin light chain junction region [Macaca mulatta]
DYYCAMWHSGAYFLF